MATPVLICNLALYRIGSRARIDSLDDASQEAIACKALYEILRDVVLEEAPWPFATKRATLALTGTPPGEWAYSYAVPGDCLRAQCIADGLRVRRRDQAIPYAIELASVGTMRLLYTEQQDAVLIYTARVDNPGLFSATFVDALAWRLAADLAEALAADQKRKIDARQLYELALLRAIALAQNEIQRDPPPDGELVSSRL